MFFTDKENFFKAGAASLGMPAPQWQPEVADSLGLRIKNKIIERGIIKWFLSLVCQGSSVRQQFLTLFEVLFTAVHLMHKRSFLFFEYYIHGLHTCVWHTEQNN